MCGCVVLLLKGAMFVPLVFSDDVSLEVVKSKNIV